MDKESDADLVTWMTLRDEDEEAAFRACEILHTRHSPLLLGWCQQQMGNLFGDTAEDFVNATFIKAFDRAETFACPTGTSAEEQKKRVIGWLFTILENILKDSFKAEAREREFRDHNVDVADVGRDESFDFPDDQNSEPLQLSPRAALAARFLEEEVDEEDADLLRLSANFFDFARNEPVFDSALLKGVCERMGLTPSGLRSRRKRILERLRQYIDEHETAR